MGHGNIKDKDSRGGVEEEEKEIFPIPESNAVVDPGTVMIHVQYALLADRTVVTSLWFEYITHETVPPPLQL